MKFSSIFYTITLIFIIATTSIFLAFLWLMDYDNQNYTRELNTKYSVVARATLLHMNDLINKEEYLQQTQNLNMPRIEDKDIKDAILNGSTTIEEITADIGSSAILLYQKRHYLKIVHKGTTLLLEDKDYQPYRYDIIKFIFGLVFFILLMTYVFIIRKIKPLRKLKRQIDKFATGNLDIKNVSTGNDEISEVADAFYNAVGQIKSLNHSRQLFLRNIMHELKTPITKGRIAAEMIEKNKNQERLINVFERLESLINEFAAVERATSRLEVENAKPCKVIDIIDEAIDLAMIEKELVTINVINDLNINADFKLMSVAFKNMIDNGIKYSNDKHIIITVNEDSVKFITNADKLEQNLEYYTEPFTQGSNAKKSFGLGLYIVDNILRSHGFKLEYEYKNSLNIFKFTNLKS